MPDLLTQPIAGFLGVNLRRDRLTINESDLARAINADLHTFLGAAVRRLGTVKQNEAALGDADTAIVRHLAKLIGTARYRVAGRSVFRDDTLIGDEILSENLVTKTATMRPLLDNTIWTFFADDAVMKKDDGTNFYNWGITAPTTYPVLYMAGHSTLLAGAYSAKTTYVRKTSELKIGHESNPSPATDTLTTTGSKSSILVSGLVESDDAQVSHIRIYRTVVNGADWVFALEIENAIRTYGYTHAWEAAELTGTDEWQFTTLSKGRSITVAWEADFSGASTSATAVSTGVPVSTNQGVGVLLVLIDSALGTTVETDHYEPPLASWCVTSDNVMFLVRDAANPAYLWWSKRFQPESFPVDNFVEIGDSNDPLLAAVSWIGFLTVWTALTKYRVTGNTTAGFVAQETISRRGSPAPFSIVPSPYGIAFVAHDGVFLTNTISEDQQLAADILPIFQGETVNGFKPINWIEASKITAATWKGRLWIAYPSGDSTEPDMLMVFSIEVGKWFFYDLAVTALLVEEDVDQLVAGSTDGFVYILEDGESDDGEDIGMALETRDFFGDNPEVRKLYRYFRADVDTDTDTVTAAFYVDGALVATKVVTGNRTKLLQRLPAAMGYSWRVAFSYNGQRRPKLYGATAAYQPLSSA